MILPLTKLRVADNSGPLVVECIKILSGSKFANIGDEILATVQTRMPANDTGLIRTNSNKGKKRRALKKGAIVRAIIVRSKKGIYRPNGIRISFDENAVVLYSNKTENLLASKISGPMTRELRKWNFLKILSLAEQIY